MDNYVMYLRKSRADAEAEARGEGETLARHERILLDVAHRQRLYVAPDAIYREIVSGDTLSARPVAQQLLREVEAGMWSGVLVMEVERLARGDSIDQGIVAQAFRYSGTRIITPYKTYDPSNDMDEEFFEFSLFMSRREYKTIKRRLQAGRLQSVKEGRFMGSRAPFGYKRVKLMGQKGYSLEIIPEKAAIIRAVFEWYAYGMDGETVGAQIIANRLKDMGIKTDLGHDFTPGYVRGMLQNVNYIGMVKWNQRVTEVVVKDGEKKASRPKSGAPVIVQGLHESIIEKALFDKVQGMFSAHQKPPINDKKEIVNPLVGLVKCSLCGKAMVRKPDYSGRPDLLHCSTPKCSMYSTYIPVVEAAILDALSEWVEKYAPESGEKEPQSIPQDDTRRALRQQTQAQIKTLEQQKSRLHDLLEQGVYAIDTFIQRSNELDVRIAAAKTALAEQSKPRGGIEQDIKAIVPKAQTVLEAYETATLPAERNALLRSVLEKVVYTKSQRCYRNQNPAEFLTLDIYPVVSTQNIDSIE